MVERTSVVVVVMVVIVLIGTFNHLKTKRRPLDLKTQFVPRSKHFISVIKTHQFVV
jgi:hypothetical protein